MSEIKVNSIKGVGASTAAITVNNTDGTCTANITNNLSNRNLIINGAMQVAQRGTSSTSAGMKTVDRFKLEWYNTDQVALTQSQSTDAPPDFSKSFKVDVTTAETTLDANEYSWIRYVLEAQECQQLNYNSSNARSVTLSFWVKSYQTGDFAVNLKKYPDGSNRSITSTYTVNQSATWEKKTITFVGDTAGGGIDDDANMGISIYFFLAAGTDFKGSSANTNQWADYTSAGWANGQAVNLLSSTDNYLQITGVQLEVSDHATDFEHRSYGQELALCQRYFLKRIYTDNIGPYFCQYNNNHRFAHEFFQCTMRTVPSITFTSTESSTAYKTSQDHAKFYTTKAYDSSDQVNMSSAEYSAEL
mgnify:CR=1 FL=1|tara:strand:+ start:997 stop:2076 length:1080 start_codon:yes stop_codon:yes gene_type:complete